MPTPLQIGTPRFYEQCPTKAVLPGKYLAKKTRVNLTAFHNVGPILPAGEDLADVVDDLILLLKANGIMPSAGNTLAGVVMDDRGPEIEGAKIVVSEWIYNEENRTHFRVVGETKSAADGSFIIEGLHPMYPYNIEIWADGMLAYNYFETTQNPLYIEGDDETLEWLFTLLEDPDYEAPEEEEAPM